MDSFNNKKFAEVNTAGYDSYFIVPANDLTINSTPSYLNTKQKTVEEVGAEFAKHIIATKTNRIFLGRLVDVLSKHIAPPKNK
jgi:hypothetical protein